MQAVVNMPYIIHTFSHTPRSKDAVNMIYLYRRGCGGCHICDLRDTLMLTTEHIMIPFVRFTENVLTRLAQNLPVGFLLTP